MKAVVFDIDGVLINPDRKLRKCLEKVKSNSIERLKGKREGFLGLLFKRAIHGFR